MITEYLPHPADLVGLAVTWVAAVILMLAGAMVGARMPPEVQIGIGWGVLCVVLTVWGVLVPFSLAIPAAGLALIAVSYTHLTLPTTERV